MTSGPDTGLVAELRPLREDDIGRFAETDGGPAWKSNPEIWRRYFDEQRRGGRLALIAVHRGLVAGYGSLLWRSPYPPFREQGIPEINDLVVAAGQRKRGLATRLIASLEDEARRAGARLIGLGVGLYADYGPAQRLYVRLGYVPDGRGVTYNEAPVPPGDSVPLDDDLVLWLTKRL